MITTNTFLNFAISKVVEYFNNNCDKPDNWNITKDNVYVVWYSKTLKNHKALVSTSIPDGMYYEVTYNGERNETYFDVYKKWCNEKFEMGDIENT